MKKLIALSLALIVAAGASAQERFVRPSDEAKRDPTFLAFRTKLIAAVKRRDSKHLLGILDPKITSSFGGDEGIADFKKYWKFPGPKTEFWSEFLTVITNGGGFDKETKNRFCAPYLFENFPADLDEFRHLAIFGSNVNLRSKPSLMAPVVAQLSYNVVEAVEPGSQDEDSDWMEIRTLGGKRGFVKSGFVRSPIDYRACFEKKRGKWKMTAFVAGD